MGRKKYMRLFWALLIGVALPVSAQDVQEVPTNELVVNEEIVQNEEVLTKEKILAYFVGSPQAYRVEMILARQEALSKEMLAEVICYMYQLAPLFEEGQETTPYSNRLVAEGIWTSNEEVMTLLKWDNLYMNRIILIDKQPEVFDLMKLGQIKESNQVLKFNEMFYPLYTFDEVNYISFQTLINLGFNVEILDDLIYIHYDEALTNRPFLEEKPINSEVVKMQAKKVYIGTKQTASLYISHENYIPVSTLEDYFYFNHEGANENQIEATLKSAHPEDFVSLRRQSITNVSSEVLDITLNHAFWNGEEIIYKEHAIEALAPYETYPVYQTSYEGEEGWISFGTEVGIKGVDAVLEGQTTVSSDWWQSDMNQMLQRYKQEQYYLEDAYLDTLFPARTLMGEMKYDVGQFNKGDQVHILYAHGGYTYYIWDDGKKTSVPWGSVSVPAIEPSHKGRATEEEIERFINEANVESDTNHLVWTDLYRQLTYVFERENGEWHLIRTMLSITGKNTTPTPTGTFKLQAHVPRFGMNRGYMCKDAVQIFEDYLYHSVMYDVKGNYVLEGQVMGEQDSAGCIRLSPEDSNWFYNTMKRGTGVLIR